jgi:putative endonuclease
MSNSAEFGRIAENLAQEFLFKNEYQIIEKNWRYSKFEVDLIAIKDAMLIIVEVKARNNVDLNFDEIVNHKKQKQLIDAAEKYLELKNYDFEVRFDVILVTKQKSNYNINHLINAFYSWI